MDSGEYVKRRGRPRKFTEAQVAEIREWYEQYRSIAKPGEKAQQLGVNPRTLYFIVMGLTYKDVGRK